MEHPRSHRALFALVIAGALLTAAGCGGSSPRANAADTSPGSTSSTPSSSASDGTGEITSSPSATATKKAYPKGPPMLIDSIAPLSGTTVGVAMPISIVFSDPVKVSARKKVEQAIKLTTSVPVSGAWHWFGSQRVDFRPRGFWKPGTKISMVAAFKHVGDGFGRFGTHSYTRSITIGADVRTHVYVKDHKTVVTRNGKVLRTMPSDAGSPEFPSWDGTMAVVGTSRNVRMTSCSVQIACDPKDPNFYDLVLPWDVRITNSGTFLHYSTGDPYPGHSYGSHGCVHLSYKDAQWYYSLSKQGDPVTITGSPRGKASGDNGYADYDVSWSEWLAGSGLKEFTTTAA
ncbi:MAG TPA: L,D-transpeptidase [Marmoricola sp.]|jgi:lipoprotein-anchoring transpeptidase ErfK/SrfK|nr:L,D-transpeptidase [Marmoricola sp.]